MDEYKKKSFDLAAEATKQLITLSTAVLALTATLVDKHLLEASKALVVFSWLVFLASLIFGIATLLALTGTLASADKPGQPPSVMAPNIRVLAVLQIGFFLLGMSLIIASAGCALDGVSHLSPILTHVMFLLFRHI